MGFTSIINTMVYIPSIINRSTSISNTIVNISVFFFFFFFLLLLFVVVFLFLLKNIDCWYSLEPPGWRSSNEYPQSMFWAEIWKISEFSSENVRFLVAKISIYLKGRVFVPNVQRDVLRPCNIIKVQWDVLRPYTIIKYTETFYGLAL